jgi:hypothetical protein
MLTLTEAKDKADRIRVELSLVADAEITCEKCEDNDNCEYAFDLYNTFGDCLAIK